MRKRRSYIWFKFRHWFRKITRAILKPRSVVVYSILALCLLGYIFFQSIKWKLYSDKYLIQKILFTTWTVASYDDEVILSDIISIYSWSYYSTLRLGNNASKQINQYIDDSPFIQSINPVSFADNVLVLEVIFVQPLFRFLYNNQQYGIYHEKFLPLYSGNTLGGATPLILLPLYLSGTSASMDGVMYYVDTDKMLLDYFLLKSAPIQWSITYIPWGEKYVIRNPLQKVYLNAKKDLKKQLSILYTLKSNYTWFNDLEIIDIGSLENPIAL